MSLSTGVRVLYADVDGTLVGPGGSLFLDGDRRFHLEAAEAVGRAREAGIEIALLSGRSRPSMTELARIIDAPTWIGELGAIRSYDRGREEVHDFGAYPGGGVAVDELRVAAEKLMGTHPRRLEEHGPWNTFRVASFMLRGLVDEAFVGAWLADNGYAWVDFIDNGVIPRPFPGLDVHTVRIYHLVPKGVSKAAGIAADQAYRGLSPAECAMVGDAHSDLACAAVVGRAFITANALAKDPTLGAAVATFPNAEVTARGYGLGFADVVARLLSHH